jgi:hypothetical protein
MMTVVLATKNRHYIFYQVEKSESEIYEMLKEGFSEEALSHARGFIWTKEFLNGQECVEDELRSGRPVKVRTDENIKRTEDLVRSDQHLGVRDISARLNIARETEKFWWKIWA